MSRTVLKSILVLLFVALPVFSWAADPLWIDVRTAGEYAAGHVSQSVNIPYEEITERVGEVTSDKNALIYLYCRSGRRSGIAKEALENAGYSNVVNIGGLQQALQKAGETSAEQ
jgi:phage shock protein E